MARISNLTVTQTEDAEVVNVSLHEDGTPRTLVLPSDVASELVQIISHRHGIAVQHCDKDGRGVAVSIPADDRYVSEDATVYVVQHAVYSFYAAAFSKRAADRIRADEVRDAREASASMPEDYYVTAHNLCDLYVPDEVRLLGRDAVLEYLNSF